MYKIDVIVLKVFRQSICVAKPCGLKTNLAFKTSISEIHKSKYVS